MRYRASQEHSELMNPGQIYEITVDLWATSNVFLRGHSLRLEISSSNFPRFDRNMNTGEEARICPKLCSGHEHDSSRHSTSFRARASDHACEIISRKSGAGTISAPTTTDLYLFASSVAGGSGCVTGRVST